MPMRFYRVVDLGADTTLGMVQRFQTIANKQHCRYWAN